MKSVAYLANRCFGLLAFLGNSQEFMHVKLQKTIPLIIVLLYCACTYDSLDPETGPVTPQSRPIDAILGTYTGTSMRIGSGPEYIWDAYGNLLDIVVAVDTFYSADTIRLIEGSSDSTFLVVMSGAEWACARGWVDWELTFNDSTTYFKKDGYQHYYREEDELTIDTVSQVLISRHYENTYNDSAPPDITNCLFTGVRE